jgi:hypothetical protein
MSANNDVYDRCGCGSFVINRGNDPSSNLIAAAAARGDLKTLERLLADGADVNAKNSNGFTALFMAVHAFVDNEPDRRRICLLLVAHGADLIEGPCSFLPAAPTLVPQPNPWRSVSTTTTPMPPPALALEPAFYQ